MMRDICARELIKHYGEKRVLGGFNHCFPAGRITCLMGESGCGKTTLLRLVMGLEAPDSGEIIGLDGVRIAPVFQEDRLFAAFSGLRNIRLVADAGYALEEIVAACEEAGLADSLRQPVAELSGGMRRRVAVLRALFATGELMIMDEPFQGLDDAWRERMIGLVRRYAAGRTAIIVTHDKGDVAALGAELVSLPNRREE